MTYNHKLPFVLKSSIFTLLIITLFSSCEKKTEEPTPEEEPVPFVQEPADVLNSGSGFSSIENIVKNLQGIGTAIGDMEVIDFTLESNSNLNYMYYTTLQSQQSLLIYNKRISKNLISQQTAPESTNFNNQLSTVYPNSIPPVKYQAHTNNCAYSKMGSNALQYYGISASITMDRTMGTPDLDLFYPQVNMGKFASGTTALGYVLVGLQNPPNPSLTGCVAASYTLTNATAGHTILSALFDWRRTTDPINTCVFVLREDSMIVNNISNANVTAQIAAVPVSNLSASNDVTSFRHYSSDGNTMAIVFKESTTNYYWTFSYNFTTRTLTKGLEHVLLDYSTAGSDVDADEYGNLYYSGIAANGSNTTGVSIYKKDIMGTTVLIGSDSFLKFGTITHLKYIYGKIHLVVSGRISGTYYRQLTFLKQN
jgi:hypothetical protein